MKPFLRIVFVLVLLAAMPDRGMATIPEPDIIYINGEKWWLLARPLPNDLMQELDTVLPDYDLRSTSSANEGGFRCVWSIDKNRMYLKGIYVDMDNPHSTEVKVLYFPADSLREVFKGYRCTKKGINAKWLEKDLRTGNGNIVGYTGLYVNLEEEMHFKVHKGKVIEMHLRRYKYIQKYRMKEHKGRKVKWPAVRILQYRTIKKVV